MLQQCAVTHVGQPDMDLVGRRRGYIDICLQSWKADGYPFYSQCGYLDLALTSSVQHSYDM